MRSLGKLNPSQRAAVEAREPALLIAAGPGTGKTRVLTHRIAHLLEARNVPVRNILAVTFTRSAAGEMKQRLGNPELWVDTFHAAALRVLREQNHPFGPEAPAAIIPEEEKSSLLEGLVPRKEMDRFLEKVRRSKQELRAPESEAGLEYQRRLEARRRLDFDDVFIHACRLLDERPELQEKYRGRLIHVLVDEFQDTSFAQYEFLRRVAGENLCVIGDPDQSIYGFAGGSFRPFDRFKTDHPDYRLLPLSENYRSRGTIVKAAQQVIDKNRAELPRELRAKMEQGLPIEITRHASDRQEAEMIARRIEGLLGGSSHFAIDSRWAEKEGESYAYGLQDIAVFFRFHAQARRIEEALERAGLPYRTFGKRPRVNGREASDAEETEDFIQNAEAAPSPNVRGEWISLMTLHRSKGLEFPVVFLTGCEDGLLPYCRSEDAEQRSAEIQEERRLFYVGMTRAKNRLFLSRADKRFLFGKPRRAGPSPFLQDIEENLRLLKENPSPAAPRPPKAHQPTFFDP